jgi:GT2 family glycosyltransferase
MHRTGSSVTARALNLLGMSLGNPDHLLKPQPDNPEGFWESQPLQEINEEILGRFGGAWDSPPSFPEGWQGRPELADLKERARNLLKDDFASQGLWGFKDPRTCLTLPFWQDLVPGMRYVVSLRNPLNVCRSLQQRNGMTFERGAELWKAYVCGSFLATGDSPLKVVFYHSFFEQPHQELNELQRFVSGGDLSFPEGAWDKFSEYLKQSLWHNRLGLKETLEEGDLDFATRSLYGFLHAALHGRSLEEQAAALPVVRSYLRQFKAQEEKERRSHDWRLESERVLKARKQWEQEMEALRKKGEAELRLVQAELVRSQEAVLAMTRERDQARAETIERVQAAGEREAAGRVDAQARIQLALEREAAAWKAWQDLKSDYQSTTAAWGAELENARVELARDRSLLADAKTRISEILDREARAREELVREMAERAKAEQERSFRNWAEAYEAAQEDWEQERVRAVDATVLEWRAKWQERHRHAEELWKALHAMDQSKSWRYTRPLRDFGGFLRSLENKVLLGTKAAYLALPVSVQTRQRFKRLFLSTLGRRWRDSPHVLPEIPHTDSADLRGGREGFSARLWKLRSRWIGYGVDGILWTTKHLPLPRRYSMAARQRVMEWAIAVLEGSSGDHPLVKHKQVIADLGQGRVSFAETPDPAVSVIIPVHGKFDFTYACLRSVAQNSQGIPYEVIVVDDASPDESRSFLKQIPGIHLVELDKNLGFVGACNAGAERARGGHLAFLNNDTVVDPEWMAELLGTFRALPEAGIVGGKLCYPDGRLQEAGGIIFRDGNGWNYGRLDDAKKPEYNYLREVDFVSGACLMVPAPLFRQVGGFDRAFEPGYYEDVDLAFAVRRVGKKAYYQPLCRVTHHEGVTSGTDVNAVTGMKRFQVINRQKLVRKWQAVMDLQQEGPAQLESAARRGAGRSIFVVDSYTPMPDKDAGSVMMFNYMKVFLKMGYQVAFFPHNRANYGRYTQELQRMGVECLYHPFPPTIEGYLKEKGSRFDFVILTRQQVVEDHLEAVRRHCPRAKVFFETVDLHFLRAQREANVSGVPEVLAQAEVVKQKELSLMSRVDVTLVVSPAEKELLRKELPEAAVEVVTIPYEFPQTPSGSARKNDILFVGGFRHPPNADAVVFFATQIFPRIQESVEGVRFLVAGDGAPESVTRLAGPSIQVLGFVPDLGPLFGSSLVSVAPLRFGAGIKGKVISSLGHGVPVVATSLAAEGMGLEHGKDILLADTAEQFADEVIRLFRDSGLWARLSSGGLETVAEGYTLEAVQKRFETLFYTAGSPETGILAAAGGKR